MPTYPVPPPRRANEVTIRIVVDTKQFEKDANDYAELLAQLTETVLELDEARRDVSRLRSIAEEIRLDRDYLRETLRKADRDSCGCLGGLISNELGAQPPVKCRCR